jgi:mRNA interferase MazF
VGKLKIGQVVSCVFPFSDLSSKKVRPALIVAVVDFDDIILCQITSKAYSSSYPIQLQAANFVDGGLPVDSCIRADKLFTADTLVVSNVYGTIERKKIREVHTAIRSLFTDQ